MACNITIDASTLLANTDNQGNVVKIVVEGHADECDSVVVSLLDETAGDDIGQTTVTPDANGHWSASFIDGQGFDLKGVACGDKMMIEAECADDDKCADKLEKELPCKPGDGGGCPNVTVTVRPGACNSANTRRTMNFDVTVAGGASIQYMWNFGDGTPLTALDTDSGNFSQPHSYVAGETYNANLIIVVPPGWAACPDPLTVVVDACGSTSTACPDNPEFVAERHLSRGRRERVDIDAQCVPAGHYTISLSNSYPAGTQLFWSVDDQDAGQDDTIEVTIGEGETVQIEVIATKDGCTPVSQGIPLSGCRECPTENALVLEQRTLGARRPHRVSTDDGCIPAGNYEVRLTEPDGDVQIDWFEDGVPVSGRHGRTLPIRVAEGQTLVVSASVQIAGCGDLNPSITIEACKCPDDLSLTVFDQDGDAVDPAQCVAPGTFTVRAAADGLGDEATDRTWSVNGREVAGDGTEIGVRVAARGDGKCSAGAPATTVSLTVTPGCDPKTASMTSLRPCAEFVFNFCCQFFGAVVLLLFGLAAIAAALAACPQVLMVPPLVAFFAAFGLVIFLALALIVAVIIWFLTVHRTGVRTSCRSCA